MRGLAMQDVRTLIRVTLHGPAWGPNDVERPRCLGAKTTRANAAGTAVAPCAPAERASTWGKSDSTSPTSSRSPIAPAQAAHAARGKQRSLVVYVCRSGRLDVTTPGGCLSLADGDACIASPSDPHTTLAGPGTTYACIEMAPKVVEECLPYAAPASLALTRYAWAQEPQAVVLSHFYDEGIRLLVKRIEHRLSLEPEQQGLELRGMIGDLLLALESGLSTSEGGSLQAERVLAFMEDNLATASLRSTAKHFFCHPNSIANLLRRSCGATFSEVLSELRTRRAATLLRTTRLTVQDVAGACGYHNMTHFYEVFRKRYGMRPGEYRQSFEVAHPEAETLRSA